MSDSQKHDLRGTGKVTAQDGEGPRANQFLWVYTLAFYTRDHHMLFMGFVNDSWSKDEFWSGVLKPQ